MAGISNYLADKINDYLHGGTVFTPPATTYFALMSAMPVGAGGGTEATGGGYTRVSFANNPTNWPASSGAAKYSGTPINWGTFTANLGTIQGVAEYDAASGGNLLTFAPFLTGSIFISNGQPFSVPVNGAIDTTGWINISNYLADRLNDWFHGGGVYVVPNTTYWALMTTSPTVTGGGVEASGGTYARVAYANNPTNWPASSGQLKTNATPISWGTLSATLGSILAIAEYDALTSGNLLSFGPLSPTATINAGRPFQIPPSGAVYQVS